MQKTIQLKSGFTLTEIAITMFIIAIFLVAAAPLMTIKISDTGIDTNAYKCVNEDNANTSAASCIAAMSEAENNRNDALTTLKYYAESSNSTESANGFKMLFETCKNKGGKACDYLINKCINDENKCYDAESYYIYNILTETDLSLPGTKYIYQKVNEFKNKDITSYLNQAVTYACGQEPTSISCDILKTKIYNFDLKERANFNEENAITGTVFSSGTVTLSPSISNGGLNYEWAKILDIDTQTILRGIDVDSSGNVYVVGEKGATLSTVSPIALSINSSDGSVISAEYCQGDYGWATDVLANTNGFFVTGRTDVSNASLAFMNTDGLNHTYNSRSSGAVAGFGSSLYYAANSNSEGAYLIKVDLTTEEAVWFKDFDNDSSASGYNSNITDIKTDSSGNIFVTLQENTGTDDSFSARIVKIDPTTGAISAQHAIDRSNSELFKSIAFNSSGDLYVTGSSDDNGGLLYKFDSDLNILWTTNYGQNFADLKIGGGTTLDNENHLINDVSGGSSIAIDDDDNIYIIGILTDSTHSGSHDIAVAKLTDSGTQASTEWIRTFGSKDYDEVGPCAITYYDGYLYAVANYLTDSSSLNALVLKLNLSQVSNASLTSGTEGNIELTGDDYNDASANASMKTPATTYANADATSWTDILSYSYTDITSDSNITGIAAETKSYIKTTSGNNVTDINTGIASIEVTKTEPANTNIYWLVSFDNGTTWKYKKSGTWNTATVTSLKDYDFGSANSNNTAEIIAALSDYTMTSGETNLDFVIDLQSSDGTSFPSIDSIQVNYL